MTTASTAGERTALPATSSTASAGEGAPAWVDRNRYAVALGMHWIRQLLEAYIAPRRAAAPDASAGAAGTPLPAVAAARRAYDEHRRAMREANEPAAIDRLSMLFDLAPFDEDVLMLALAPRFDSVFHALYAAAHDRAAMTHATAQLALGVFADGEDARGEALGRLGQSAPLKRWVLLSMNEDSIDTRSAVEVDDRIAGYILGRDELDRRVRACLRPALTGPSPVLHAPAIESLMRALVKSARPAAAIVGPRASGRRAAAAELAARLGLGIAALEPRTMPAEALARQARFALIAREARLGRFAVTIDLATSAARGAADDSSRYVREIADDALNGLDAVLILTADDRLPLASSVPTVHLTALGPGDRVGVWRRVLSPRVPQAALVNALADQFALDPDDIAAIAAENPDASDDQLWSACRHTASCGLDGLAERIEPRFGWDDIVLPEAVMHDLRALVAQVRHRLEVYHDWGFGRRLPRGRGVTALFSGPSGTGKTMAAEVVAGSLNLDLYRIDLSSVVSKYIGETEKNLRRVFDTAEAGGAVLFFDEADALFGKRSEVRDSHDRYANIEVSYLLQRMEAYAGLAVLATNLKSHLDTSFLRRLRYVIEIPFPDASLRRAIWQQAFPSEAPTNNLDLDALARLEIPGGHITVIAVNAAFLAAADHRAIDMSHVARAARAEFRKLDKEFRAVWPETT